MRPSSWSSHGPGLLLAYLQHSLSSRSSGPCKVRLPLGVLGLSFFHWGAEPLVFWYQVLAFSWYRISTCRLLLSLSATTNLVDHVLGPSTGSRTRSGHRVDFIEILVYHTPLMPSLVLPSEKCSSTTLWFSQLVHLAMLFA